MKMDSHHLSINGLFADSSKGIKILVAFLSILLCSVTFSTLGYVVMKLFDDPILSKKWLQLLSALGTFVCAPCLASILIFPNWKEALSLHTTKIIFFGLALISIVSSMPFINYITQINAQMHLPDCLKSIEDMMRMMEDQNGELTKEFLAVDSFGGFLLNIIVLALIPAVGEELLFRGFLQKCIEKISGNIHIGIWVAAILFSAIHCQFYGFFPRMIMGALFGYFLYWSDSIFVPMACHFFNNSIIVVCYYFMQEQVESIENLGNENLWSCLCSLFFVLLFCETMRRFSSSYQNNISNTNSE